MCLRDCRHGSRDVLLGSMLTVGASTGHGTVGMDPRRTSLDPCLQSERLWDCTLDPCLQRKCVMGETRTSNTVVDVSK